MLHIVSVCAELVIQHEVRMRHVVICGLPKSSVFFPHYLIVKGTNFGGGGWGKNVIQHKMCVLIFSKTLSATLLMLRRIEQNINNV